MYFAEMCNLLPEYLIPSTIASLKATPIKEITTTHVNSFMVHDYKLQKRKKILRKENYSKIIPAKFFSKRERK